MPIYLLLFALFSYEIGADYAGYNAAGRNPGWRSGSEHDPLNVPDVYHKPNEYENQPHAYWYENRPFPHGHSGQPDTYAGKLHQHMPGEEPPAANQNFITDPPGVGLNAPEERDNFPKNDCGQSDGYEGGSSNCAPKQPRVVRPTTKGPVGPVSTKFPYKSAHSSIEELINESSNTTDVDIEPEKAKVVSVHETESVIEDATHSTTTKKPCCPCCKQEETNLVAKATAVSVRPTLNRPNQGSYIRPSIPTNGGYPIAQNYHQQSPSYSSSYSSSFGGGCQSSSYGSYGGSGCCQQEVPSCCAPQLPCCPRIEFPCCPQQPICCQPSSGCGQCRSRVLRQRRTKRFGCIPCAGRRKRDVMEEIHIRRKRLGCIPCLRRKKREQPRCIKCSPFTSHLVHRIKRSAAKGCADSRSASSQRTTWRQLFGLGRSRRAAKRDSDYDSVFDCDKSCCDYSKCVQSKPLKQ